MHMPWIETDGDVVRARAAASAPFASCTTADAGPGNLPANSAGIASSVVAPATAAGIPLTTASVIETSRLAMRYLRADDVGALMPILSDADVTRYLSYTPWVSEEEGKAWCHEFAETNRVGSTAWFLFTEKASGRVIGNCVLFNHEAACGRAELGYMLGREYWRKGFAYEAASALIHHGFQRCGLQRIEAQIHVANIASQQLAIKLGFQREGLMRKRLINGDGVPHDVFMFGLLRGEAR